MAAFVVASHDKSADAIVQFHLQIGLAAILFDGGPDRVPDYQISADNHRPGGRNSCLRDFVGCGGDGRVLNGKGVADLHGRCARNSGLLDLRVGGTVDWTLVEMQPAARLRYHQYRRSRGHRREHQGNDRYRLTGRFRHHATPKRPKSDAASPRKCSSRV